MRLGDIVNVTYPHPDWQTVGIVTRIWGVDNIQVTPILPKRPNRVVGAFEVRHLELLGHIDLEEGEEQNANRR